MLSIQIDTKVFNWSFNVSSTTSNCPSLQAIWNWVSHYARLIDAARLLDTLVPIWFYHLEITLFMEVDS